MTDISLVVIARNAAAFLPACLASAKKIADETVVVVDDRTQDSTVSVARKLGARVYVRKFVDFSDQKNFAASQAIHDWVLFLDADERLTPTLAQEMKDLVPGSHSPIAYRIPRLNYIFGKAMSHTNWDPRTDAHVWLYDRRHAHWEGAVHEQVVASGPVGQLTHPKIHTNYTTVESFISKLNQYTSFEAKNRPYSPFLVFLYPAWKFVRHYFIFAGFLDGWHGLFLSYLQAIYGLATVVKSWEIRQNLS